MIKLIYRGALAPTIDPEKYIWVDDGVNKIWNGNDWVEVPTDLQGKIDDSLLPDTIVRKLELQQLIDDLGIHSGADGAPGADGIGIRSTTYWFKLTETDSVTEPDINTNPESEGWTTDVQNLMVSYEYPYLWCFCRIIYTNDTIFQTEVYIVSKYNADVDAAIEELRREIEEEISEDITSVENRLSDVEGNYAVQNISSDDALVEILTGYQDPEQTSFADIIADAAKGTIDENVGAAMDDTTTSVGQKMDAINGELTAHATALDDGEGGLIDVRQSMNALEGEMTSSVAKATYCWVKNDDNPNPQDPAIKPYNGESTMSGYTKKVITNELSVIKQSSDEILLAVGDGTDNRAALEILGNTYDGNSKIILTGNTVEINGGVLQAGTIDSTKINTDTLVAKKVNAENNDLSTVIVPGQFSIFHNNQEVFKIEWTDDSGIQIKLWNNSKWCTLNPTGVSTGDISPGETIINAKFNSLGSWSIFSSQYSTEFDHVVDQNLYPVVTIPQFRSVYSWWPKTKVEDGTITTYYDPTNEKWVSNISSISQYNYKYISNTHADNPPVSDRISSNSYFITSYDFKGYAHEHNMYIHQGDDEDYALFEVQMSTNRHDDWVDDCTVILFFGLHKFGSCDNSFSSNKRYAFHGYLDEFDINDYSWPDITNYIED